MSQIKSIYKQIIPICCVLMSGLALSPVVNAAIYHYVDSAGHKYYVDSLSKIPKQYQNQIEELRIRNAARNSSAPPIGESTTAAVMRQYVGAYDKALAQVDDALKQMETPVDISGNRIVIPVMVSRGNNKLSVQLVMDTGATNTVVHREVIGSLSGATYGFGEASLANGNRVKVDALNIDTLAVGPYKTGNMRIHVIDHAPGASYDGLLGMDFLSQIEYRIDFNRGVMVWNPRQYDQLVEKRQNLLNERNHPQIVEVSAPQPVSAQQ